MVGTYTAYDIPAVDAAIGSHMACLTELCRSNLGNKLDSLVLSGSFGRGEGSVLIHEDGMVEPLRDYDVRIIVKQPVPMEVVEHIRAEFMHQTGLGGTEEHFSGEQGFSLTLEPLTLAQLASTFVRDRDLRVFDHLHASRVIYGQDRSTSLRFDAHEIPKVNGLRFLYQKMIGLVGHFSGPETAADTTRTLAYECDKTFIEICTALVLLADRYVPSYQDRAALFAQHWRTWFPELAQALPELADDIKRATEEKLRPGSTLRLSANDAFTRARVALLEVHRFYLQQLYGVTVTADLPGYRVVRKVLKRNYFMVAVTRYLTEHRLNSTPTRLALNTIYHRLLRYKFAHGACRDGRRIMWESMRCDEAPPISIFLAAWCALAAIDEPPRQGLLAHAETVLGRLPGTLSPITPYNSTWDHYAAVRNHILHAYSIWEKHR